MLRAEVFLTQDEYSDEPDITKVFSVEGDKQSVVDALRAWCDRNDETKKQPFDSKFVRDFFGMKP